MSKSENIQFFEQSHIVKEESWGGKENKVSSIAFKLPEGINPENIEYTHVVKEPRSINYFEALADKFPPQDEPEKQAIEKLSKYFDSGKHFMNSRRDYKIMKEAFGDLLLDTQFIIGEPREGNELGFYILQKRINGKTATEFSDERSPEKKKEYLMQHRDQFIDLIGGARKVLVEMGSSADIWGDNIMVDEKGNFFLIDPGSPSEFERHFSDLMQLPEKMRSYIAKVQLGLANKLESYPNDVEMTNEEIEKMNEKFGITQEQYEKATTKFIKSCKELRK